MEKNACQEALGHQKRTASELAQVRAEAAAAGQSASMKASAMEADMNTARDKLQRAKFEFEKVQVEMEALATKVTTHNTLTITLCTLCNLPPP